MTKEPKYVLVICLSAIGDNIMVTPMLEYIKKKDKDVKFVFFATDRVKALYSHYPDTAEIIQDKITQRQFKIKRLFLVFKIIKELKRKYKKFEYCINLHRTSLDKYAIMLLLKLSNRINTLYQIPLSLSSKKHLAFEKKTWTFCISTICIYGHNP